MSAWGPISTGVLAALFAGKWLATESAARLFGYLSSERNLMFALTIPQVAATLAVALVAYATVVLVIVSSLVGLLLTESAVKELANPGKRSGKKAADRG